MNLTLTLFLAQSSRFLETNEWAIDVITNVCGNYFQPGGDILAYYFLSEEEERRLMEGIMKNQYRKSGKLLSFYNSSYEGGPSYFVKFNSVILLIKYDKVTYLNSMRNFMAGLMKNLHLELRVVLIVKHQKFLDESDIRMMLEIFWNVNIGNVIVLSIVTEIGEEGMRIFFWRPDSSFDVTSGITTESIRKISFPMRGDAKDISFAKNPEMYSVIDSRDIKGKFLRVSVSVAPPYAWRTVEPANVTIKEYMNLTTDNLDGIEISILRIFRQKYNLNGFFIVHPSEIIDLDHIEEEFHDYTLLEETALGVSDVAIGGNPPQPDLYLFFTPTAPYFEDSMYWYVPSAKEVQRWKILFMIFDKYVWSLIAVAHLVATAATFALFENRNSKKDFSIALLSVWATILNQPTPAKITGRLRLLFAPVLLYGMHVSAFYQSSLVSSLGDRKQEVPIASLREAKEKNMKLCLSGVSYDFFQKEDLSHENMSFVVHPDYIECLDEVAKNRNHLALMPEKTTEYTIPLRYLDETLAKMIRKMPKKLIRYPVSMYLTKASPFKERLDFVIDGLLEGGIINKWWDDIRFSEIVKTASIGDYRSISLGRASGIFSVFLLGVSISVFVFILEIMWDKIRTWKKT